MQSQLPPVQSKHFSKKASKFLHSQQKNYSSVPVDLQNLPKEHLKMAKHLHTWDTTSSYLP